MSRESDIDCEKQSFPRPPAHGSTAFFVLDDDLHAHLRQELPADADDYVLTKSFNAEFLPEGPYCILLTTSDWRAGSDTGGSYEPYTEYSLKIREIRDDGTPVGPTPPISLAVSVVPQYDDMVYKDGKAHSCPYGTGAKVRVQTTGVQNPEEHISRAAALLEAATDCDFPASRVKPTSKRVTRVEVTHRFAREYLGPVIATIRDTEDVIAAPGGAVEAHRTQTEGHLEAQLVSSEFDRLGFQTDEELTLKVYTGASSDTDGLLRHPRIEAQLYPASSPSPHFDEYEELLHSLRSIVASHCVWADLDESDLVTRGDPVYDGSLSSFEWNHPAERKRQLRQWYDSVMTTVREEALKPSTMAVYDILNVVLEYPGCTYKRLVEQVGLSKSSIRRHVARLADEGILRRIRGVITLIDFDAQAIRDRVQKTLRQLYPDDTREDRKERREERRQQRQNRRKHESLTRGGNGDENEPVALADTAVSPDELADRLQEGTISQKEVFLKNPPPDS